MDLHNYHPISTQAIRYFESVPWFLKLYLHTLKVETTAETGMVYYRKLHWCMQLTHISRYCEGYVFSARNRSRPTVSAGDDDGASAK